MNKLPPLNWLRAFEASARHLSFSLAANELFVTQSAISQHIKLLENYLNQKLFIRTPKKLQLTDAGKCYLPVVSQSFHMLESATEEVFGSPENIVYCYSDIAFATHFISPRLHDFYKKYPGIEVRLQNSVWWQRRQNFDSKSHVEIRYGTGHWRINNLISMKKCLNQTMPLKAPQRFHKNALLNGKASKQSNTKK